MLTKKFNFSISLTAGVLTIIFFLFVGNFLQKFKKNTGSLVLKDIPLDGVENLQVDSILLDIDGDGKNNLVLYLSSIPEKKPSFPGYIVVYDEKLKEIARTPREFNNLIAFLGGKLYSHKLDKRSKKGYLRMSYIAGAHHFKDFFLTKKGDKLIPVCKKEEPKSWDDCEFFASVGDIEIKDYDKDGLMEVIEYVDEYTPEGGRGNIVVQGIYEFNGKYFKRLEGKEYAKFFKMVERDYYRSLKTQEKIEEYAKKISTS